MKNNELIKRLYSGDVEYKALSGVCIRQRGISITAAKMKDIANDNGDILIFGGGKTKVRAMREDVNGIINEAPSVVVKSRGNIGFEFCNQPFTTKSELWSYRSDNPQVNIRFIYYYLDAHERDFREMAVSGKLPQISVGVTDEFKIPIPPLPVQEEIVRILDSFSSLEAELEARRKQYAYYRNELLTFDRERV